MMRATLMALLVVMSAGSDTEPGAMAQAGSAAFQRQCDMICHVPADWFDTLQGARDACSGSSECVAVVDHSANSGRYGLCDKEMTLGQGSKESAVFRGVCVEHKLNAAGDRASLLQVGTGRGATRVEDDSALFARQCDTICDVQGWHQNLAAARQACAANKECLAVADHSANAGKFGLCLKGTSFERGSEKHEVFRAVCVERKRETMDGDSVNLMQMSIAESSASNDGDSALFARECDMMCDGTKAPFRTLAAARRACVAKNECIAVSDHSGNDGYFGLCFQGATFERGSAKHEVFRRVCVERKREAADGDSVALLQTSVGGSSASAGKAVTGMFARQCDMICDHVSEWFGSMSAAQQSCASSNDCVAVIDHSANKGTFGLCSKSATFSKGSGTNEAFRAVCVEKKRDTTMGGSTVALLQTAVGGSLALTDEAVTGMFTRQCDMICDNVSNWFASMHAAQQSCASSRDCVAVIDHSVNKGHFGLCTSGATFAKGSEKSEALRRVCVEHKNA